ncbi:glycosyltransferase family 2 protein [Methanobacterium sp.]|uniref:glycosyltransferase family 2 protein n=1 Tax=Methanobacterium sp. TaxID=2164 RepID=UPI003C70A672
MNNKETICAVVVTYNRKKLLLECLESLRKQSWPLDAIYLIDNASTDGTSKLLLEYGYINEIQPNLNKDWEKSVTITNITDGTNLKFHYVRMHENTGGAGGFHEGVKKAYEKGYNWLWLMDDDAEPDENALKKLTRYFNEDNVSAFASVVKNINGEIEGHSAYRDFRRKYRSFYIPLENKEYFNNLKIDVDFTSFVGILINRSMIKKIGFPKKEFFIHGDDADYCIRLNEHGRILLVTGSYITHKYISSYIPIKKIGRLHYAKRPFSNYWLFYYTTRNAIWFGKTYSINRILFYINVLFDYLKHLIGIIVFDDHKLKRTNMITNAYLDGLKGIFDNDKPKRILYNDN